MAVDPTSGISQMMEILRRQLAQDQTQAASKAGALAQAQKQSNRERTVAGDQKALERKIAARIRLLPINSDKELRTAIRVFLEGVLLAEFGDELGQDPMFYEMVDGLAMAASADKELSGEFKTLFKSMA